MPEEFLAVEIGEGTSNFRVYCEFLGAHDTSRGDGYELKRC